MMDYVQILACWGGKLPELWGIEQSVAANSSAGALSGSARLLWDGLSSNQLIAEPRHRATLHRRLQLFGENEWRRLVDCCPVEVDPRTAIRLLGSGFGMTEFLVAPVISASKLSADTCSLGALINLMVVICDRLLDGGESIDKVLPQNELASGGGESSPVMILLREYSLRLSAISPDEKLLRQLRMSTARMFEAEIQTVRSQGLLPFRFWLRKSSLPFVLMGLPVWANRGNGSRQTYWRQARWLFRVGRFLGALDDVIDFAQDIRVGHPNYLSRYDEARLPSLINRIADWGGEVMGEWDGSVLQDDQTALARATFLHLVTSWFEAA